MGQTGERDATYCFRAVGICKRDVDGQGEVASGRRDGQDARGDPDATAIHGEVTASPCEQDPAVRQFGDLGPSLITQSIGIDSKLICKRNAAIGLHRTNARRDSKAEAIDGGV